jgi:hypothetical protein
VRNKGVGGRAGKTGKGAWRGKQMSRKKSLEAVCNRQDMQSTWMCESMSWIQLA